VLAVERDRALVPALLEVLAPYPLVRLEVGDASKMDWDAELPAGEWTMVSNLPYNVAVPLLLTMLDRGPRITEYLVMVQREVGERFAAPPGSKQFGAVSVKVAYWATAKLVGSVPPSVFVPRPNVESALVRIVRHEPPDVDRATLFMLVRTAFQQRRKMLRRSLSGLVTTETMEAAGISPQERPEQLGIEAWCRLAKAVTTAGNPVAT
jgi:16S rRNA (adenine1518-N6/adenine1519-N6)-dimethyltransferase